jgi:hypothetical protein
MVIAHTFLEIPVTNATNSSDDMSQSKSQSSLGSLKGTLNCIVSRLRLLYS